VWNGTVNLNFLEVIVLETETKNKQYEAMFLIDSAVAASDWDGVNAVISRILEKAGAETITMKKWDERKLAYDIRGKSRGTYILCYFKAPAAKVHQIEREVQLSEKIIRVLILKADQVTAEDMAKETPAMLAERGITVEERKEEDLGQAGGFRPRRLDEGDFSGRSFDEEAQRSPEGKEEFTKDLEQEKQ
jgi:small subunit ribosomal protein S6